MIKLKSQDEIEVMKEGGRRLRQVVKELLPYVRIGATTLSIDGEAEKLIKKYGGEASFKKVKGYKFATCLPVNEQVVHTPPSERVLKEGDLLTIDIGMYFGGFHTDFADSFIVGKNKDDRLVRFLKIGQAALEKAITKARGDNRLGEISLAIEREVYGHGYFILKSLTGHGIGRELHEDPIVPGFLDRPVEKTPLIRPGLVIAIEVIYSMGSEEIRHENGKKWSIITADKSLSACFEHTVAITEKNTYILT